MSAGQISDDTGAAALLDSLPKAEWLLADRGYDVVWFREALKDKGMKACIPGRKSRKKAVKYDKRRDKTAQPYRDHVRAPEGLETRRNPIRSVPGNVLLCDHARSNRLVLAVKLNESGAYGFLGHPRSNGDSGLDWFEKVLVRTVGTPTP